MTKEQVQTYTKQRVMECTGNQNLAKRDWKAGKITKDEWLNRHNAWEVKKKAFQAMCAAVIAGEPE